MNADSTGSFFLPVSGSTISTEVDSLFNFVFFASLLFFLLVVSLSLYFVIRYKKRPEIKLDSAASHNTRLEIIWTLIPLVLVFVVFVMGFRTYLKMHIVPKDPIQIKVTSQKWFWTFDYIKEGINSVNELVVPVGKPVQLTMSSVDVIHSFFVPGFRIKMDVLPNRYTVTWFEATQTGSYDLFCAEYCGKGHSEMIGKVRVVNDREYTEWLEAGTNAGEGMTLAEFGAVLYQSKACITCHSVDGKPGVGPTFKGRFGITEKMADETTITVDENYIRESLLNPMAKVVYGYQPVMPSFQGVLKDKEIDALIEYIKSLDND